MSRAEELYLAVCAIFRDEAAYLPEWLEFHREYAGVEHFLLFDNGSLDGADEVLAPWVRRGVVTLVDWRVPFARHAQREAYKRALNWGAGRARWIAFLDIDEFLFSPDGSRVCDIVRDYERHPGVVVNWHVYGSSGIEERPGGLVTETFVRRAPTQWVRNRRVKSIVDPTRALSPLGPHFFAFGGDERAVTENHVPVDVVPISRKRLWLRRRVARAGATFVDPFAVRDMDPRRVSAHRLRINHYAVRSRAEFAAKIERHRESDPAHPSGSRIPARYWRYHDRNEVLDPVLAAHATLVRKRVEAVRVS